ncbi:hypothetical protein evm_015158 [Chilo suppressalis]|nr:hypothetical protein evm_015158 [Chilo suppressalis]
MGGSQRFIWLRYDATAVYSPSLVTETSQVTTNAGLGLSLININRNVEFTANIAPVRLAKRQRRPASAKFLRLTELPMMAPKELAGLPHNKWSTAAHGPLCAAPRAFMCLP